MIKRSSQRPGRAREGRGFFAPLSPTYGMCVCLTRWPAIVDHAPVVGDHPTGPVFIFSFLALLYGWLFGQVSPMGWRRGTQKYWVIVVFLSVLVSLSCFCTRRVSVLLGFVSLYIHRVSVERTCLLVSFLFLFCTPSTLISFVIAPFFLFWVQAVGFREGSTGARKPGFAFLPFILCAIFCLYWNLWGVS